ncbi:IQ domain-containing protein C [Nematolebias whitei]|uniref:IQ domain-containing protein C n=1 Tax=Nematolebias whitei TaxID=451745 RepID=UPI0018998EFE|nr:IQ domain-containing protein C [Nematolebias whitei]
MDRSKWTKIISNFQACARGYLVRSEVRRAREDFEEIVVDIDGGLTHLKWTKTVISIPLFTDDDGPLDSPVSSSCKPSEAACAPLTSAPSSEEAADLHVLLEREEAERDDSQACCSPSIPTRGHEEEQRLSVSGGADGGVMESVRSSNIWNDVEPDRDSRKGPPRQCRLAQDVPRTPEDLRLHRNTLTMELVWLQQAIDSRKKYLALKNRLSVS